MSKAYSEQQVQEMRADLRMAQRKQKSLAAKVWWITGRVE